jgi:kynurenine formamidase
VLLQTGADPRLTAPVDFAQPSPEREGSLWLVERGVKAIGIDAYTLDMGSEPVEFRFPAAVPPGMQVSARPLRQHPLSG